MTFRMCARFMVAAAIALTAGRAGAQSTDTPGTAREPEAGPPPIAMSLNDAIQMSLQNNLDIKIAEKTPMIRQQDVIFQDAAFDPNVSVQAFKQDSTRPTQNLFDIDPNLLATQGVEIIGIASTFQEFRSDFRDPLMWGGTYTASVIAQRFTSTSTNELFPTTYRAIAEMTYSQSFLRNFGQDVNKTQIVIATNNEAISRSQLRGQTLTVLQQVEDAYWELVFARQDLAVKRESLRLAEELLKLNRIKVQVGTLPPIEITTAEAEVASRDQNVIVAENAVRDSEDNLRKVLNMPKESGAWDRPIEPTDQPDFIDRPVNLESEIEQARQNRPSLQEARLTTNNADAQLEFDRRQRRWDLTGRAVYRREGLGGDIPPGRTLAGLPVPVTEQNYSDAFSLLGDRDLETWSLGAFLNIPIGNNALDANYLGSRLEKEQSEVSYQNALLAAEVEVRTAARAIQTNKKRIEAAEKNVELQRKKVEAEQKKFENGMSTSFQVLEFQEDLTTALGQKNRALVDYRKSITLIEKAKGTLDGYLNVTIR